MGISNALLSTEQKIVEWNSDFDNNYEAFTNLIADLFAKQIMNDFAGHIDPYKKPMSEENKYTQKLSLDITKKSSCEKISELFRNNKSVPLQPFKEWLTIFSLEEPDPQTLKIKELNTPYFTAIIDLLGTEVTKKVTIKLFYYNKNVSNFCTDAKMHKQFVKVRVWLKQPSEPLPQIIQKKTYTKMKFCNKN